MIKLFEKLLNLIYIQPCYFCKSTQDDSLLCKKCYSRIHFMPKGVYKNILGMDIYSAVTYDGIIKTLVRDLKYHNKKKLAKVQAQLMFEYWQSIDLQKSFLLLPVPIHKLRKKERKYNHMDLVAKEFVRLSGYNLNTDFLLRIKDTHKQFNLNKKERIENIKNAFELDLNQNIDKSTPLLIIDDITSTGITLEEIIKLLKNNGYKNIVCLTLATPDIWN